MFELLIEKNKARVLRRETLTARSEGYDAARLRADFDSAWEGLSRIAVFRAGETQIDLAMSGDTLELPLQVLLRPDVHLLFGVYGISDSGAVVIPTVWADLGLIQPAADPGAAENYSKPAMELYAQIAALARAAQSAASAAASGVYAGSVSFALSDTGRLLLRVTENGQTTETDLGAATAYAAAREAGYAGTYAQFQALLTANYAAQQTIESLQAAVAEARDAAASAVSTAQAASAAAAAAASAARSAGSAAASAQSAVAGKQAQYKARQVLLPAGANVWTDVSAEGVTAANLVIWSPAPASFDAAAEAGLRMTAQGAGTVSFAASDTAAEDLTVNLAVWD